MSTVTPHLLRKDLDLGLDLHLHLDLTFDF